MKDARVFRRRVYHIGGYDQAPPDVVYGRFVREARRFEGVWGASVVVSPALVAADVASWQVAAAGPNWRADTEFHLVRWDDLIAQAHARPMWSRLPAGILAFLDFIVSGTLWRYLRASWRYALFFLYPVVVTLLILAASVAGGLRLAQLTGSAIAGVVLAAGLVVGLFLAAERWLYLGLLFDDWIFARRYIRQGDAVLDERLRRLAAALVEDARTKPIDEILVIGHSLGAVLAIDMLDHAIAAAAAQGGPPVGLAFVSVGSSTLKLGLHRAAAGLRARVGRISAEPNVFWADYQARSDVMNFYGGDLLPLMGLARTGSPLIRSVSIRRMIDPQRYPRLRRNWYRMHCQFVRGNDRRAPYDYFMFACGPVPAQSLAQAKQGAMDAFDSEGRLNAAPEAASARHDSLGAASR